MNSDADAAAAYWLDVFDAVRDTFVPQEIHRHLISQPGYLSTAGPNLPNFDAVNDMAFTPAQATSMRTYTSLDQQNHAYPNVPDAWSMYAYSVAPQLVGDPNWRRDSPFALYSAAATPNVVSPSSSTVPPASQNEWASLFETGQSSYATPSSLSSEAGLVAPEYGTFFNGITTSPAESGNSGLSWPTPAASMTPAPIVARGKRRRDESYGDEAPEVVDSNETPPQKRLRGGKVAGIPKAARTTTRTRHKAVTRIPKKIISKPKEAGRGAERLATPHAPEIYHRPLLGPSFQQMWVVESADGQVWVEGSVEEEVVPGIDSTVQQQQQQQQQAKVIPRYMNPQHKAMLAATQEDWDNGMIDEIRCRICCPNTPLNSWDDFKRHCDTSEMHPLKIHFCDNCGDYFTRSDALKQHRKRPPPDCRNAKGEKAAAKRAATEIAHGEFKGRLTRFLETGEDFGAPFCEVIKAMHPDSSKKRGGGRKVQSQLEGR